MPPGFTWAKALAASEVFHKEGGGQEVPAPSAASTRSAKNSKVLTVPQEQSKR